MKTRRPLLFAAALVVLAATAVRASPLARVIASLPQLEPDGLAVLGVALAALGLAIRGKGNG